MSQTTLQPAAVQHAEVTRERDATPRQRLRWMGLSLSLPAGWWVSQHSTHAPRGSLHVVDRQRQRLILTWADAKATLDVQRLRDDWLARQREQGAVTHRWRYQRWWGMSVRDAQGRRWWQAVTLDATHGRMVEVTMPRSNEDDDAHERALLRTILRDCNVETPADAARRVTAFGADLSLPRGWRLWSARVLPASVSFTCVQKDPGKTEPKRWVRITRATHAAADEANQPDNLWRSKPQHRWRGLLRRHIQKRWDDGASAWSVEVVMRGISRRSEAEAIGEAFEVAHLSEPTQTIDTSRDREGAGPLAADIRMESEHLGCMPPPESRSLTLATRIAPPESHGQQRHAQGVCNDAGWLAWVPSVNPAVRVTDRHGSALLAIPIRRTWWTRALRLREQRVWALDATGTAVWRLIDGRCTLGEIIDAVASRERLSHAQARGGVGAFVRELMRRGAVVVVAPDSSEGGRR